VHPSHEFTIEKTQDGMRLDQAIAQTLSGVSRREARRLIEDGSVFVDGERTLRMSRIVKAGTRIRVASLVRRENPDIDILATTGDLVFVNKGFGVPTEPTAEAARGSLVTALGDHLRAGGERVDFLAAVHRLDVETTGVVCFARTPEAAERMRAVFSSGKIERRYLAACEGTWASESFESHARLETSGGRRVTVDENGQDAVTRGRVIARSSKGLVLAIEIDTGRRHQIRVHLAHEGLPLVGDRRYGRGARPETFGLHALSLAFGEGEQRVHVDATPSEAFMRAAREIDIEDDASALLLRATRGPEAP
jgi:23S rRNA pseudouridine1911/1915/1917 synthase